MRAACPRTVLMTTVGGSHAPIVRAIRDLRPDFVWFICTEGRHGSETQIRGQGNCIKAHPRDDNPTLPNIPTQTGLHDDQYDTLTVPPDDPDETGLERYAITAPMPQGRPNSSELLARPGEKRSWRFLLKPRNHMSRRMRDD